MQTMILKGISQQSIGWISNDKFQPEPNFKDFPLKCVRRNTSIWQLKSITTSTFRKKQEFVFHFNSILEYNPNYRVIIRCLHNNRFLGFKRKKYTVYISYKKMYVLSQHHELILLKRLLLEQQVCQMLGGVLEILEQSSRKNLIIYSAHIILTFGCIMQKNDSCHQLAQIGFTPIAITPTN